MNELWSFTVSASAYSLSDSTKYLALFNLHVSSFQFLLIRFGHAFNLNCDWLIS
jgi:hypothetical protein